MKISLVILIFYYYFRPKTYEEAFQWQERAPGSGFLVEVGQLKLV